jgi:hypothetical protein
MRTTPAALIALAGLATAVALAQPTATSRDFERIDVCRLVPGEAVARALGGALVEARTQPGRCAYFVVPAGHAPEARRGYVVWVQPPADFEALKEFVEAPTTSVPGLGDDAYAFLDPGDGRFKINVLKRGDLMFQATGESAAAARRLAEAAWTAIASPPS